jgi:hypothetical protein
VAEVALRPIDDSDLDALFEQMRDPESVRMAAFTAGNPDDRTAFDARMAKVPTLSGATTRAVTVDGRLADSTPASSLMASDNVRSLKVLQRAGFAIIGTAISFANARDKEIDETILRLDEPTKSAPPDASSGDRQTY